MAKTEPRTLSGFMELLPSEQILFNQMKEKIEEVYKRFGIFTTRYTNNRTIRSATCKSRRRNRKTNNRFKKGDTDLSLRFDLTVPLAKYVAKKLWELKFFHLEDTK